MDINSMVQLSDREHLLFYYDNSYMIKIDMIKLHRNIS